jgi:hypothetical protein
MRRKRIIKLRRKTSAMSRKYVFSSFSLELPSGTFRLECELR